MAACSLPLVASAMPDYDWDLQVYYPHAEPLPASLSSQQLASISQFDGFYPTTMVAPNGSGLTTAEMDEVAAMPGYFSLVRDPVTGVLSGRDIIMDGDADAIAQPDLSKPASFYADFIVKVERLTDLYAMATSAQAPQLEQVYSDLIEHFLDLSYLPGGRVPGNLPLGNGYLWRDHGWKTLRMMDKLSADKRDLYALSLAHVCGFSTLLPENSWSSTDIYYNYYATANKALALMSDTPAKWQLMRLVRRGMDVSTIGWESDPVSPLTPLGGSIIHHEGHSYHYGHYSYAGQLVMHTNWTTAGFTSVYTAQAIVNMRRASLAWCFTSTGGLMPYHQKMEGSLLSGTSLGDGGVGNGPDFALKAANLTSAYYGTPIADDLEMAYAAISKTGVGSTALPTQWRTITPPANIASTSPPYTATLQGHYSRTTNGTSIQRGPENWYESVRGQPSHWDGGEARAAMGMPDHFGLPVSPLPGTPNKEPSSLTRANFAAGALLQPGDSLRLSLDFRYAQAPPSVGSGLRFGLYNAAGDGFLVQQGIGGATGWALAEDTAADNGFGSGGTVTGLTSASRASLNDQAAHTLALTLTRTATGIVVVGAVDDSLIQFTDTIPVTTAFEVVGIRHGNLTVDFAIDNVHVEVVRNRAPYFTSQPLVLPIASTEAAYAGSVANDAREPNDGDALTFMKIAGPAWLTVATDGTLSGTAATADTGSNSFTVRVTDSHGLFSDATLLIEVGDSQPPIEAWRDISFESESGNSAIAGNDADPDGDGLPNLIEYALGLDPNSPSTAPAPQVVGGTLSITYTVNLLATDANLVAEWSGDLANWGNAGIALETLGETGPLRTVRASNPAASGSRFLHLKVTGP